MDPVAALTARHEEELRELEAKIEALKLSDKGNKKQKKAIQTKVANLTREVTVRQEEELYSLKLELLELEQPQEHTKEQEQEKKLELELEKEPELKQEKVEIKSSPTGHAKKPNRRKANKERKQAQLLHMMEEAEKEAKGQPNLREQETLELTSLLNNLNLSVYEIPPDGHCLYSAITDQLQLRHSLLTTPQQVRQKAAEYIIKHAEDFLPFLTNSTGDPYSQRELEEYCEELTNTAKWGGQIEINALAQAYQIPIIIYQGNAPPLTIDPVLPTTNAPLTISYHRHAYSLGAHYNSLRPRE